MKQGKSMITFVMVILAAALAVYHHAGLLLYRL